MSSDDTRSDARERASLLCGTVVFGSQAEREQAAGELATRLLGMNHLRANIEVGAVLKALGDGARAQAATRAQAEEARKAAEAREAKAMAALRTAEVARAEAEADLIRLQARKSPLGQHVARAAVVAALKIVTRTAAVALSALGVPYEVYDGSHKAPDDDEPEYGGDDYAYER